MKFGQGTFDILVRPRVLTKAIVCPIDLHKQHDDFQTFWMIDRRRQKIERFSVYTQPPTSSPNTKTTISNLFSEISLGNTQEDLSNCYVGVVTHFVVKLYGTFYMVDKNNFQEMNHKIKMLYGKRTNLKIYKVGIQIFKGIEKDNSDELHAINPWTRTKNYIWFFDKADLVPMKDIMQYESARVGGMVVYKRTRGFIVAQKILNKPRFYSTNSWSCMTFKVLYKTKKYGRFLPNRPFTLWK